MSTFLHWHSFILQKKYASRNDAHALIFPLAIPLISTHEIVTSFSFSSTNTCYNQHLTMEEDTQVRNT